MKVTGNELTNVVKEIVNQTPVTDIHTHLFAPHFGGSMLAGIDELLTYHYLISEVMRESSISYEQFWNLTKPQQADFIWKTLFVENTPYSEARRGVVTVLNRLGVDLKSKHLGEYRKQLAYSDASEYVNKVFQLANVESVVMTNDPFDPQEREVWLNHPNEDKRFHAALRIDPLINHYEDVCDSLQKWGFQVERTLSEQNISELQRFTREWIERMNALYVAVSLPNTFAFPDESVRSRIIAEVIVPVCRNKNIPFALMIGVKRGVNPLLQSAGDSLGKSNIEAVEKLCSSYPQNKFMVTMLSKENQHELAVTARKFRNLMVFGCWWFLNNPSLISEITAMRFELLGSSVIPQHSDCRILDQLIYKWDHSRKTITNVLVQKYEDLIDAGWSLERDEIKRDVEKLFGGNFWTFLNKKWN